MTEASVIARVRPVVMERDAPCRIGKNLLSGMGPPRRKRSRPTHDAT